MGMLTLAVTGWVLIRKRCSAYGAICLGVTAFVGLFLLDTAVLIRIGDGVAHKTGFDPAYELHYFLFGGMVRWTEMFANIAVFVPFGFFLSESLASTKSISAGRLPPARPCDLGRLRAVPHYRVPPAAPARGLFRIDGSGDEYGGGVCGGFDFGGGEEGGGWAEMSSDW